MRSIKFRGKSIDDNEWLYGDLVRSADMERCAILVNDRLSYDECEVNSRSVGQFTDLYDKNGNEIYEGDVLSVGGNYNVVCEFKHGAFGYSRFERFFVFAISAKFLVKREFEVIGNIHDNPELLKGGEK